MSLAIVPGDLDDTRVRALIAHHLSSSRATGGCDHALEIDGLKAPGIRFWAAWDGERLLGVGALQRLSHEHGEVKSMHTASGARRRGVADAMLLHIIDAARAAGMRRLSLETGSGDYFTAARALYQKHGFVVCGPFGGYPLDESSVFMTRSLASSAIRRAQLGDAAEMARLSGELGYPLSTPEMARRLATLLANERHVVAVAATDGSLVGWLHVEHRFSLEGGERAELMGLVVDSKWRRGGLGRELVGLAEAWALSRGIASLVVRSNAARGESHPFYEALGYSRHKTQHVYGKTISGADTAAARALPLLDSAV